jgi:hypothetical protein
MYCPVWNAVTMTPVRRMIPVRLFKISFDSVNPVCTLSFVSPLLPQYGSDLRLTLAVRSWKTIRKLNNRSKAYLSAITLDTSSSAALSHIAGQGMK